MLPFIILLIRGSYDMNEYSVFLINGIAYQCQQSKMTLHLVRSAQCDLVFACSEPAYALIRVIKAKPLSFFIKESICEIALGGQISSIEFIADDCSMCGDFAIETVKKHKKGSVSFTAKSFGEITYTAAPV